MIDHLHLDEPAEDPFYDVEGYHTAWDLIGFEGLNGKLVRVAGGRSTYEAVMYNDTIGGEKVKLARLETLDGLHQINRYVDPETVLEIVEES